MHTRMLVVTAVATCLSASGQDLSIGLIGGVSATDAARDTATPYTTFPGSRVWSQSKDWMAGLSAELRIRPWISVEVDGMYRELHVTWASVMQDGTLNSVSPSPVVTWEFPVLAKHRFGSGAWKPFVEGGPAFRTTGNLNFEPSHFGGAVGGGVETVWKGLAFAPTLRYTRWLQETSGGRRGSLQPNQLEFLLGVSRASESNWSPVGRRVSLGAVAGWGLTTDYSTRDRTIQTIVAIPQPGGGYTYTQVTATGHTEGVRSLIAGPSVEVHLNPHLSLEIDALHKPLRTKSWNLKDDGTRLGSYVGTDAVVWQFPVLAKYRFRVGGLNPFVEAGPSFRLPQWDLATHGLTGGAGVQMHWRALNVAPAVRYSHWGRDDSPVQSDVRRNEVSLLVGVSFGGTRLR